MTEKHNIFTILLFQSKTISQCINEYNYFTIVFILRSALECNNPKRFLNGLYFLHCLKENIFVHRQMAKSRFDVLLKSRVRDQNYNLHTSSKRLILLLSYLYQQLVIFLLSKRTLYVQSSLGKCLPPFCEEMMTNAL